MPLSNPQYPLDIAIFWKANPDSALAADANDPDSIAYKSIAALCEAIAQATALHIAAQPVTVVTTCPAGAGTGTGTVT